MLEITIVTLILFIALLLGSVWVGLSLFGVGYLLMAIFKPNVPLAIFSGKLMWSSATSLELLALPLFVLMSEILVTARLSRSLFTGLSPWVSRFPGGLTHINVAGSTLFAAVSGSSAATTAIVGKVTLSELLARGYDKNLSIGSLAGAGTLGFLIPPSIIMIIYGVVAEQPILELFVAGIVPGLLLAVFYSTYIGLHQLITRKGPPQETYTWSDRWRGLREIGPIAALIVGIMTSLYAGLASPTELAAVGVSGAIIISVLRRTLTFRALWQAGDEVFRAAE